ncbi:hypothetical protein BDN70DRAFT_885035 [Pholiota conissans]|uniref:Uncharacterized protein n=1 Tax=Pholiota conissans TaxID=109636 RepID=A0A9P6CW62_9AGAR|nr:hypothetical protein BDN70DRAFT_885035 [Pholiota conissans]
MAAPGPGIVLAERADVHKSCKSIENLLVVFNEYCEASGAIVALQKKLAKALREMAGMKVTGEIAVNAMNASAAIFDALSEVDSRFAKIADKEYESVSTDVKKWFKKLNKEERNHDDRIASANAKIKQAGQNYEKKSKKKATDASDEHARYINLISTLGPEISQEKYNHALNVTQRHTATTYSVAACLSRLADSEWQKSCECVRRFSPTIGPLGRWKALCEGGWTGPVPSDLPNVDNENAGRHTPQSEDDKGGLKPIQEEPHNPAQRLTPEPVIIEQLHSNPPEYSTGPPYASASSQDLPREHFISSQASATPTRPPQANLPPIDSSPESAANHTNTLDPPRPSFVDANTGSVRSLSAFPNPPTHFPIPPLRPSQPQRQQSALSQSVSNSSSSNLQFPSSNAVLADSPVSAHSELEDSFRTANQNFQASNSSNSAPKLSPTITDNGARIKGEEGAAEYTAPMSASPPSPTEIRRPMPIKSQTSLPAESSYQRNRDAQEQYTSHRSSSSADLDSLITKYRGQFEDSGAREFGMMESKADGKARTVDNAKYPKALERMDTGASNGSLVAAMRNRYSTNSGSMSPPPRDLPRIPLSVNDLASRYQPGGEAPLSPKTRPVSPPVSRQQSLPLLDTAARQAKESYQDRIPSSSNRNIPSPDEDRRLRQQQRNDELVKAERFAKEQELKEREKDLEMRARDLERERARLQSLREEDNSSSQVQSGQFGMRPRERRTSLRHQLQRPLSQMTLEEGAENALNTSAGPSNLRQKPYNVYGGSHLAAPLSPTQPLASPKRSQNSQLPSPHDPALQSRSNDKYSDAYNSATNSTSSHASNCGCESCSVSKYGASGKQSVDYQSRQVQPPERGQHQRVDSKPDKPKSWMRRLSVPVGNALGLDSSKKQQNSNSSNATLYNIGSGIGNTPAGGRGLFSMDGKKNASTTALGSRDVYSGADRNVGVREDGRLGVQGRPELVSPGRRSYDISGVSNRSMTNLGVMGRH